MKTIKLLLLATLLIPVQIVAQDNIDAPELLVMTWGESYHYLPPVR